MHLLSIEILSSKLFTIINFMKDACFCLAVDICSQLPSPANGHVELTDSQPIEAQYSCDAGYTLAGDRTRTCLRLGTWTGVEPTCTPITCYHPYPIRNGNVDSSGTSYLSVATYSCHAGYSLQGQRTRSCLGGDIWSGDSMWSGRAPTCVRSK